MEKVEKSLSNYIESVLNSEYSNEHIQNEGFVIKLIDVIDGKEFQTDTKVVPMDKLKYIQMVTKLETMIKVFDLVINDNNIVCCDEFIEDFKSFKDRIIAKLETSLDNEDEIPLV